MKIEGGKYIFHYHDYLDVSTASACARVESTEDLDLANQLISFATGKPGSPASSLSTLAVASSPHVAASSPFSGRGRDLQQLRVGSPGRVARGGSVDSLQVCFKAMTVLIIWQWAGHLVRQFSRY